MLNTDTKSPADVAVNADVVTCVPSIVTEYVAALVATDKPVMVICSALPELAELIVFVAALADAPIDTQEGLAAPPGPFT